MSVIIQITPSGLTVHNYGPYPIRDVVLRNRQNDQIAPTMAFIPPADNEPFETNGQVAWVVRYIDVRGVIWFTRPLGRPHRGHWWWIRFKRHVAYAMVRKRISRDQPPPLP